ncbi:MAG: AIR synthase related protein, partial [Alphaproteobacteria bacterium]|nr:AIR synthase related protein [Alphaproteobacteria bacterium]
AYEIMLSESQERMLMILRPGATELAYKIFAKWELDAAVIGSLTNDAMMRIDYQGKIEALMPLKPLVDDAPQYDRPAAPTPVPDDFKDSELDDDANAPQSPELLLGELAQLLGKPDFCSKAWIYQQFDSLVGGNVVMSNGTDRRGDAAVVRIEGAHENGRVKGVTVTVAGTPHFCAANAKRGGEWVVLEAWRKLTATGSMPIALTNNLNFGNPERPPIMRQFIDVIHGMSAACRALDLPIVSGNVSLYNETDGVGIMPTPVVGGVGVMSDCRQAVPRHIMQAGCEIYALPMRPYGINKTKEQGYTNYLGNAAWRREFFRADTPAKDWKTGQPPEIFYDIERKLGEIIRQAAAEKLIAACHQVNDGGMLVALAEMLLSDPQAIIGAEINLPGGLPPHYHAFGSGIYSYVVAIRSDAKDKFLALCAAYDITPTHLGQSRNDNWLAIKNGVGGINLSDLGKKYFNALRDYMENN